jgi:integrase
VPLLGLFTGAREAELCQLYVDDVYRDDATSLWLIDINQREDKTLKNGEQNARRIPLIPSSSSYADKTSSACLPRRSAMPRGEFPAFSKRFNRYKESVGVGSDGKTCKDFHSFRHNGSTYLVDHACPDYVINAVTGHSQADQSLAVKALCRGADWPEAHGRVDRQARLRPRLVGSAQERMAQEIGRRPLRSVIPATDAAMFLQPLYRMDLAYHWFDCIRHRNCGTR